MAQQSLKKKYWLLFLWWPFRVFLAKKKGGGGVPLEGLGEAAVV